MAAAAGVDFVPLCIERFDLLMRQRDYFRPPLQTFLRLLSHRTFQEKAQELGGLDISEAGTIVWTP